MDSANKIMELEERINFLEEKLNHIIMADNNTVSISSCSLGSLTLGNNSSAMFHSSTAGTVINGIFDDAEDRIDDLESRIDEAEGRLDDLEVDIEQKEN